MSETRSVCPECHRMTVVGTSRGHSVGCHTGNTRDVSTVRFDLHEQQMQLLGELVEALDVYGTHSDRCSWWDNPPLKNCNCGYTDLLTRARQVGAR